MRPALILAVSLATCAHCAAQEADVEKLLAGRVPEVQEQIARIFDAFNRPVDAFKETQRLKELTDDKEELVKQLAIYAASPGGEQQPLVAVAILLALRIPPKVTIRVLAPYLDTDQPELHSFVRDWFHSHDNAGSGWSALKPVNYDDYKSYVSRKVNRNEEVPAPFVKYIYEQSPDRALLVFVYGSRIVDFNATQQQRQEGLRKQREILLSERIVSNAVWLKRNELTEQFHTALPDAMAELEKLAKHEEWWARLYVVYIMRQHPVLLRDHIMRQLREDSNELVSEAANFETD